VKAFKTALVTIVEADGPGAGTLQALCGRASKLIRVPAVIDDRTVLPVVTYLLVDVGQTPGSRDHRALQLQMDVWATDGTGGIAKAEDVADRLEAILIEPNFRAQNVDAAPVLIRRRDGIELEEDLALGRRRVTLEIDFALQRA
jgi:hypothetical protein